MRRRSFIQAGTSFAAGGLGSKRVRAATDIFDPDNPVHVGMAYRKLGWSGDEALTMHWMYLTRYGMVDTKLHVLWESVIGVLYATKDVSASQSGADPGDYDVTSVTLSFYLDPATGAVIDKFTNPWTGETLDVPYGSGQSVTRRHKVGGLDITMPPMPGMTSTASSLRKAWTENGEIWVRGDLDIRMEATGDKPTEMSMGAGGTGMQAGGAVMTRLMQVNDWFTYHGKAADVMDPGIKNPLADLTFNDLNTWSTWLKMGDQPGNFVGRGFGRKVFAYDDMPETWRKLAAERYPDVAKNPERAVKG